MENQVSATDGMVPVLLREFLSSKIIPVDIFIKLSDNKYVHLFKKGDELSIDRIKAYEERKIDVLYVRKEDYGPYVNQHIQIAGILLTRKELENKRKSGLVNRMATAVLKELDGMGFNKDSFDRARSVTQATVQLVETKISLSDLFESLANASDRVAAHSMAVSAVSVMIAHSMGWAVDANIERLALAALLHDIGKKELPPTLLDKPRAQMSFEEIQQYESHTVRGVGILGSLGIVPDDVLRIVNEHHEKGSGQGFPRRLVNARIHPMARIVALANEFVNLTMKNPNLPNPKTPTEALDYIDKIMGQPYAKDVFKVLKEVVLNQGAGAKKAS